MRISEDLMEEFQLSHHSIDLDLHRIVDGYK